MLSDHTSIAHDPSSPSTADSPSLSVSSTSLDSGSGRYQPGLILYPYRRSSTSSLPSPSLIPVWKGLGGGSKRSGLLFGETKASPLTVSVADSPKPLSSMVMLDPLGAVEPKKKEDKTRPSTKESLKPIEMLSEVVVARSDLDPATITVRRSEDMIKPSHISKKPNLSSIPAAAASNLSTRTVLNESAIDGKVVPSDKSPNLRSNDSIVKKLNIDGKKHSTASSLPIFERRPPSGDNSRVYVSKQALATIGRGFSMKPLRLGLKVKDTTKGSGAFKSESAEPNETKQLLIQYEPPETNVHLTSQTTSNSSSTTNSGSVNPHDSSSTVESDDPPTDDPLSTPSEATTRSGYCSQAVKASFIVDDQSPLVNDAANSPRDTSDSITLSDGGKAGPAPSVPIFKQRPSSGEWNRKDVFRRMSAMVQAPAIKPLGLKRATIELDSNQMGSGAARPASAQTIFPQTDESKRGLSQPSELPANPNEALTELNNMKPVQVKSSVPVARDSSPTTHDELMDLFDEVQDLYSTPNAPKDPPSYPDDLIRDAFVLDGKVVPVSRSAGSRQDVSANQDFDTIEKEDEAFKEWSPSWQDAFSKASAMAGLAPVKPLRVTNKAKWLAKKPTEAEASDAKIGGVDISMMKLGEVESGQVRISEVRPLKAESCIVQATVIEGLAATVCGMAEVQSSEAQICTASPDGSLVEIPVKVESVPSEHGSIAGGANTSTPPNIPDIYVSAYEDCSRVVVKTAGRKSRKEGINRDLLYAYHVFRAPQPSPNQEPITTNASSMSGPKPAAAVDPGFSSALVSRGRTDDSSKDLEEARPNESLTSAFDSDSDDDEDGDEDGDEEEDDDDDYDFGRDYFVVESDPFEYDLIASGSSQVLSSELLAVLDDHDDDSDDDSDDYGTNPFEYDYHLDTPSSPNEVTPLTPVLESSSAVSSPESTPPTTPTSIDLLLALPPAFDVAGKLIESPAQNEHWAWNDMDDMDEDRECAIGTAL
ncbi:hypothetical protein FRC12_024832 [Ceratobasidium sp. 428]|nr:hypothetical protein FRC09_001961 [Ceratobasidium sp. 395]KAG8778774.1 hypothetical protein FRC12_024832 [Ceratobasidium sp. 428]